MPARRSKETDKTTCMSSSPTDEKNGIDQIIERTLLQLAEKRGVKIYPFLVGNASIESGTVDDVYDDLCAKFPVGNERLEVIVHSSGGDLHAAFNLALLFRRYASEQLSFIVP